MFVTFQYRGLHHLELYCTLTTGACLKLSMHFDCRYLELRNACIYRLVYIVSKVRNAPESEYRSIDFLSIFSLLSKELTFTVLLA